MTTTDNSTAGQNLSNRLAITRGVMNMFESWELRAEEIMALLDMQGKARHLSQYRYNKPLPDSPDLMRRQLTLMASWTFSTVIQAECAQFIVDRRIPAEKVFTDRYERLDKAEEAYKLFDKQDSGKGVFLF